MLSLHPSTSARFSTLNIFNKVQKKYFFLLPVLAICALYACTKSPAGTDNPTGFDKTAMLSNYADGLIIPRYQDMQLKMAVLQTAAEKFLAAPSTATQAELKDTYRAAHLQYEKIAAFQFGPAETRLLDLFANFSGGLDYDFNTAGELTGFSVDTTTIENNIAGGNYDLSKMTRVSFYAQGFPAMDYLFFAPGAVVKYTTNATKRIQYTQAVVARLKGLVDQVSGDWVTYRAEFVANTKTNVGSPIGNLVNQMAYQLDLLKGPRVGWPFGKQSGGQAFPSKTEAYYAGISAELAVANLTNLRDVYTGAGSGHGLSDYLVSLNHAALNDEVTTQFNKVLAALQLIPDPLSTSLTAEPAKVEAAYKEIQKLLTLFKTDVASATGVQITFTDNDGD